MMPHTLSPADYLTYLQALNTQTAQRVSFTLMQLDHTPLHYLDPVALDGQVDFADPDADDQTLRSMQAGFFDPDHALYLDTDAPTDGVAGMNRLIRATVSHRVDALDKWVSVHAFTGRPAVVGRDGSRVTLQVHDKSALHLRTVPTSTIDKNTNIVKAIHDGLYAAGERFFRFPVAGSVKAKVLHDVPVGGPNEDRMPWKVWRKLARDAGLQLFYDGAGFAVLRRIPTGTPLVWFDATNVTSNLQTETDLTGVRNAVVANGHKKERDRVDAARSEEFSAFKLRVGSQNWVNLFYTDETDLRGKKLTAYAKSVLARKLTETTTVQASVAPLFHLDPLDRLGARLASGPLEFSLREASVPFSDGGDMSIGAKKRVRRAAAGRLGVAA